MKLSIKQHIKQKKQEHPVYLHITHKGQRAKFVLFHARSNEFKETILKNHPHYFRLYPKLMGLKSHFPDWEYESSVNSVKNQAQKIWRGRTTSHYIQEFAEDYIKTLTDGNQIVYKTAVNKILMFNANTTFQDLNFAYLTDYKNYLLAQGLKKNSVHNYLRTIGALYNAYAKLEGIKDNPFEGIYSGITVKANRTRKKYISDEEIVKLIRANLKGVMDRARSLWLLSFYLGGMNLSDLLNVKKTQIHRDRLFFSRQKVDGYELDVKIFNVAWDIIQKYEGETNILYFAEKSDIYTFKRNTHRDFTKLQKHLNINVMPKGGNFTHGTARHTFSSRGVAVGANREVKALLMGHELNDVQSIYEFYPEEIRDVEHWKIIDLLRF